MNCNNCIYEDYAEYITEKNDNTFSMKCLNCKRLPYGKGTEDNYLSKIAIKVYE